MNLSFNYMLSRLCPRKCDYHVDISAVYPSWSCVGIALRGLTTSKPGVLGSAGRGYSAERTLRLRLDTAPLTLRSEPLHAFTGVARAEESGSMVTPVVAVGLGLAP